MGKKWISIPPCWKGTWGTEMGILELSKGTSCSLVRGNRHRRGTWVFRPFSRATCLSGGSPCYALGACGMEDRNCGTEPWPGTLVSWGMLGLVVPKP